MRKLMCLVPDNYEALDAKGVSSHILQRDLNGYWDKVITVHPFCKREQTIELSSKHTVKEYRMGDITIILKLCLLAKREKVTLIKAHDPHFTGPIALILSRLCRLPYAVMVLSSYELARKEYGHAQLRFDWLDRTVAKTTMGKADVVLGGSADICRWAIENGARDPVLVRTIGIADDHFVPPQERAKWQGADGTRTVLLVGRLDAVKYPENLITSYLSMRLSCPDIRMLVVGDGPMKEYLMSKYCQPWSHIEFLGFVDPMSLAGIMASADVALVGLGGSALVELALAEVPTVAYDVDWHSELIHDGSGVLVPLRDWRAMADEASKLLNDRDGAKAMGRKARQTALAQHGLDVVQEKERQCLDEVLSKRREKCISHK